MWSLFTPPRALQSAVLTLLIGTGVTAQAWGRVKPTVSPPGRMGHAMVYDSAQRRAILFGGLGYNRVPPVLADTWAYDGATWTLLKPRTSPLRRYDHAMAYDASRKRIVMYGGTPDGLSTLTDTWEWDGSTWSQRFPTTNPGRVVQHAMAYDAARKRVVLHANTHTWEWDGSTWVRRKAPTNPPALSQHAMTYDLARQRVFMFGGGGWFGTFSTNVNDSWEWDGSTWTKRMPAVSPPVRSAHSMAYDAARHRILMFGGADAALPWPLMSDSWEWDGQTWSRVVCPKSPTARCYHSMVFDPVRRRMVLFGGTDGRGGIMLNDTWEYAGLTLVASGSPRPGSTVSFAINAPGNAGRYHQLGSSLGIGPMAIDNRFIDLAPDHLMVASTSGHLPWIFSGYRGVIDSGGKASAALNIPNLAALIGTRIYSAFVTLDPKAPSGIWGISNTETFVVSQ